MMLMARHSAVHVHDKLKSQRHIFDYVVYFFTIATPLFELPQAFAIFGSRDTRHVSLLTWSFFLLSSAVWALYSWQRKLVPIFISSLLYTAIETVIVAGLLIYA